MMRLVAWAATIALGVVTAFCSAKASTCDDLGLSTAQKGECWERRVEEARAEMQESLGAAIATAAKLIPPETNMDFRPDLRESQQLWERWAEKQCAMEGAATMGSAGAIVESMCIERLTRERINSLYSLTDNLMTLTKKK